MPLTLSMAGRAFIKAWEGCHLRPYQDVAGLWTVGVGHLLGAERPTRWSYTEEEIDALLVADVGGAERGVVRLCGDGLAQCHFDALVSFAFNCGLGRLQGSTLRQRVLRGDPEAGDEFLKWNRAGGRVVRGLTLRRQAERDMYRGRAEPEYDS